MRKMRIKLDQLSANNPNPVLSVANDGTVLYSNEAGEPLLHEWGVKIGGKLPSIIQDLVQRLISRNIPEKVEIKVGNRAFVVAIQPLPDEKFVNIYGFDVSDQKKLEEKLRENEEKYRNIVETSNEGIYFVNDEGLVTFANKMMKHPDIVWTKLSAVPYGILFQRKACLLP
jgi:PAS domain-containing protein